MDRSQFIIRIVVGAAVFIIIILFAWEFFFHASGVKPVQAPGASSSSKSATWADAPAKIVVPEKGSPVAANVAPPETVGAAAPGSSSDYRSFTVKINLNAFVPDTVIVNQGDVAHVNITAVDHDYDFFQPDYGLSAVIPKGQTKTIQFGATASGKFTFYCKSCGGPEQGPVGYLVIAPK